MASVLRDIYPYIPTWDTAPRWPKSQSLMLTDEVHQLGFINYMKRAAASSEALSSAFCGDLHPYEPGCFGPEENCDVIAFHPAYGLVQAVYEDGAFQNNDHLLDPLPLLWQVAARGYDAMPPNKFRWQFPQMGFEFGNYMKRWYEAMNLINETSGDSLPGGLGDKKTLLDVDCDQAKKGIRVEMEHTDDPYVALEIAIDHLTEDPLYYDHLEEVHTDSAYLPQMKPSKLGYGYKKAYPEFGKHPDAGTSYGSIDKKWIDGIRKWVKKVAKDLKSYKVPRKSIEGMDAQWKYLQKELSKGQAHIREAEKDIERFRKSLVQKGFAASEDPNIRSIWDKWGDKIDESLKEAENLVHTGVTELGYWEHVSDPKKGPIDEYLYEDLDRGLRRIENVVGKAGVDFEAILSRKTLRFLTSLVKQWGDDGKLATRDFEPEQLSLGKMKVVFHEDRHPAWRKEYIRHLDTAHQLLKRKGLDRLWYGLTHVRGRDAGQGIQYKGYEHQKAAAVYWPEKDAVYLYSNPKQSIVNVIVHELGHRYYYRFMSKKDRAEFDSWFHIQIDTTGDGITLTAPKSENLVRDMQKALDTNLKQVDVKYEDSRDFARWTFPKRNFEDVERLAANLSKKHGLVSPVSDYGGTVSEEDFAEVFMHYVMGKDMSRDQLERFKRFLGRKATAQVTAKKRQLSIRPDMFVPPFNQSYGPRPTKDKNQKYAYYVIALSREGDLDIVDPTPRYDTALRMAQGYKNMPCWIVRSKEFLSRSQFDLMKWKENDTVSAVTVDNLFKNMNFDILWKSKGRSMKKIKASTIVKNLATKGHFDLAQEVLVVARDAKPLHKSKVTFTNDHGDWAALLGPETNKEVRPVELYKVEDGMETFQGYAWPHLMENLKTKEDRTAGGMALRMLEKRGWIRQPLKGAEVKKLLKKVKYKYDPWLKEVVFFDNSNPTNKHAESKEKKFPNNTLFIIHTDDGRFLARFKNDFGNITASDYRSDYMDAANEVMKRATEYKG